MDADEMVRNAMARLADIYRPLDDLWAARRDGPHRDAYAALGYALCCLDDAREGLERAHAAYADEPDAPDAAREEG